MKNYPLYDVRTITDLRDMLNQSVDIWPNENAFLWKNGSTVYQPITFKEYQEDVHALGTALWDMGYAGKKIVVTGENCYPWAVVYMAVICGLGIICPVDKEINKEEMENIINISGASLIIHSKATGAKLTDLDIPKIYFDDLPDLIQKGKELIAQGKKEYLEAPIDTEGLASLIFTSGTTGVSKGVMLSQKNICKNLMAMSSMVYVGHPDVVLSVLPLHHVYECTCGFLCQLYRGCCIAYCEGLRHIPKNMQEAKVTYMLAVPVLIESLYKRIWASAEKSGKADKLRKAIKINNALKKVGIDMSRKLFKEIHEGFGGHLRLIISGGAAIDPTVVMGLRDLGILCIQGYGLSECAPIAALNRDKYYCDSAAGLALPGADLEVVNIKEDGTGDIRTRGDNVMLGYYENPELTAEVMPGDGWYYTGDIGYLDKDGFLHITGRKKNVIVTYGGKNVFPEELETYLARNPYVTESVVIGIMNDKKKDYDIVAGIVPNMDKLEEDFGKDALTPEFVQGKMEAAAADVNKVVQSYKHIDVVITRYEEFPKNTSKKIKRYGLEELLMEDYKEKVLKI